MRAYWTTWARRLGCCALALGLYARPAAPAPVRACAPVASESARVQPWPAPLDRRITLHLRDLTLRDALDRLAAAARLRLSYSDELLPLERPVCATFHDVAVGDALTHLLADVAITPIPGGPDQVVLAPTHDDAVPPPVHVVPLDRIVVTGSATGTRQRELPIALSVVGRRALDADATGTMSQIMDAAVPGLWMWEQSPTSVVASFGSLRGASSFGATSPKVYLDGIEVANPLLLSQIAPGAVERIEVIRGPQGAALYGADALSGVVNIVTRREHLEPGTPRRHLQSAMGMTSSSFAPGGTLTQEHAFGLHAGSDVRSAGFDLDLGTTGAFLPGAFNRHATLDAGARVVGAHTILTGTARLFAEDAGVARSPLLPTALAPLLPADSAWPRRQVMFTRADSATSPQTAREYTIGGTATFMADARWTHALTVGLDGYRLGGVTQELTPIPSTADSALRNGGADRGTVRLSSVGRFGDPDGYATTLTFAAEHSALRESIAASDDPRVPYGGTGSLVQWQTSSALVAQGEAAVHNSLFLTGGLRAEEDGGTAGSQGALLPVLGTAVARELGPLTVKLRAAYGAGIRPAQTAARATAWGGLRTPMIAPSLQPERQSGVEAGLDLMLGDVASLQITRYDQLASGLIQCVGVPESSTSLTVPRAAVTPYDPDGGGQRHQVAYQLQNVGSIANRGWEMQATTNLARLYLSGTLAYTDSRVQSTASGYSGDLQPGDRVLGVPAWTGNLLASWTGAGWSTSLGAYRAYDWIDYNRMALASLSTHAARDLYGSSLRSYWMRYPGITHLRATASRDLGRGFTLLFTGDNLLNQQVGEPDNVTVLPGRTITLGVRAAF